MKKSFLAFAFFVFISNLTVAQLTINEVTLPATLKKVTTFSGDTTKLILNGGGVRKKMLFKLYVAGLYVTEKTKSADEIINGNKAEAMRLVITSGMISGDNMSEAIEEGFKKSTKGFTAPIQSRIDVFTGSFKKEPIKEGDIFEIWFSSDAIVRVYKNEKLVNTITGIDFKNALFGIWFSDNPVDEDLKKGLLGL